MNKNTVIFDMDGVIIDSEPFWREAQINELAKYNVTVTAADCIQFTMGKRLEDIAKVWCLRYQLVVCPSILQQGIMQSVIELILEQGCAKPGLHSLLNYLKEREFNIGLATSSSKPIINAVLQSLGIHSYFSIICSADDEPYGKPHPDVYLTTAQRFQVNTGQCLVIEDSVTGMIAGKAAAMTTWVVPENSQSPEFSIADAVFSSLIDVRQHLDRVITKNINNKTHSNTAQLKQAI
ncbi:hexitol phosphatase HxpB [Psychromonas aquimarina]|uniref:hexitol phosphatase HxpB n=1 Tax=Psychromonas aquimarina TaxID=444919 RepID=UPI00041D6C5E|nr:hexitol phosphatase HxpB [Psychromonas aquimarina]